MFKGTAESLVYNSEFFVCVNKMIIMIKKKHFVGFTLISSIKLSIVNRVSLDWLWSLHANSNTHARINRNC